MLLFPYVNKFESKIVRSETVSHKSQDDERAEGKPGMGGEDYNPSTQEIEAEEFKV